MNAVDTQGIKKILLQVGLVLFTEPALVIKTKNLGSETFQDVIR